MRKFFLVVWALSLVAAVAKAKRFEFPADTFSFSNALYFDYRVTPSGGLTIERRATGKVPDYSRHCFVLVRAILQFHKKRFSFLVMLTYTAFRLSILWSCRRILGSGGRHSGGWETGASCCLFLVQARGDWRTG